MYGLTLILHYKIYTGTAVLNVYSGDGTVLLAHGGVEMGQGLNTKMIQIAACKLNIPMDFIRVAFNSTEQVSFWGAFGCWFSAFASVITSLIASLFVTDCQCCEYWCINWFRSEWRSSE